MRLNYIDNTDCLEGLKALPDKSVDLIITDPPYGIDLTPQRAAGKFHGTTVMNDANLDWLGDCVRELHRVAKNGVCVFCGWQTVDRFKQEFEKAFKIKNILVWDKDWFGMGNNYRPNYELCLLCCKTNIQTKSNNKSNILKYRRLNPAKMRHSCEKPVDLIKDLIIELSNPGDTILDPFMGSGTTAVAALRTGRNYIGFELDEKYHAIAQQRIADTLDEMLDEEGAGV